MKKIFLNLILIVVSAALGAFGFEMITSHKVPQTDSKQLSEILLIVLIMPMILLLTVKSMTRYLEKGGSPSNLLAEAIRDLFFPFDIFSKESTIKTLPQDDKNYVTIEVKEDQIKEVIDSVKTKIEGMANDYYFSELKEKIKINSLTENFEYKASKIENRVRNEIVRLSRSGIINLSLGMLLSVSGIAFLGYSILNSPEYKDLQHLIMDILPRGLFVFLIEVFAYFFLKLYKQNLEDIKYYQNELTNIESKNLALQVAKQLNNYKLITITLEELIKTERNFILEKDQTTIELEKERINANNSNNALQAVKDIFKSKN